MELTPEIIAHFKFEEGYKTHSYLDTKGYWTVGIGHMLGKDSSYEGIVWTDEEIMEALSKDLDEANTVAHSIFSDYDTYSTGVQLALLDMSYELGHRLTQFNTFIGLIEDQNWAEASSDMLTTLWAKQVPHRAARDAALIAAG